MAKGPRAHSSQMGRRCGEEIQCTIVRTLKDKMEQGYGVLEIREENFKINTKFEVESVKRG